MDAAAPRRHSGRSFSRYGTSCSLIRVPPLPASPSGSRWFYSRLPFRCRPKKLPAPEAPAVPEPTSRADTIEQARREKAKNLTKPVSGKIEKAMHKVEDTNYLERLAAGLGGWRGRFGGLATGQGFALGPGYTFDVRGGDLRVSTFAVASAKKAYQFELLADLPNIAGGKFPIHLAAIHSNFPEMDYYGPGPDSQVEGESAYRLERTSFDADAAFKPVDFLRLGFTGGYLQFNVGPGPPGDPSADQVYSPGITPGVRRQTDFLRAGGFVEVDYRDIVGGPRSGGFYSARFLYYDDQRIDLHTFRRLDPRGAAVHSLFQRQARVRLAWPNRDDVVD